MIHSLECLTQVTFDVAEIFAPWLRDQSRMVASMSHALFPSVVHIELVNDASFCRRFL